MSETTIFRRSLAPRLDELPGVRSDLRSWLKELEVPSNAADDIVLAAWELCANAIEHPRHTSADVTILGEARPRGIRVAVRDAGTSRASFSRSNRGLGLRIVEGVVDRLAIRRGLGETEVVLFRGTPHALTGHV
jgi:anti-sigma regulatory factor (Ser/Thr protein kinase)